MSGFWGPFFERVLFWVVCGLFVAATPAFSESTQQLQDQIDTLQRLADNLDTLHRQLQINKDAVFALHQRANDHLQGNILKVYLKGSMEIYNKVTAPLNGICDLVAEVYLNLKLEPEIWTVTEDRVVLLGLSRQAGRENARLALLYESLADVMQQDAERFDDDMPPLRHTKPWWGTPDGTADAEIERVTRKLKIIRELSDTVYLRTDAEMQRVRDERRLILAQIAKRSPALAREKAAAEQRAREMAEWHRQQAARQTHDSPSVDDDGRGPGMGERFSNDRIVPDGSGETAAQRAARIAQARADQAEMERTRLVREKNATVYVDSDCPRAYVAGDNGLFLARIDPEDVAGYFVWRLDDRVIGRGSMLRHVFTQPGSYDLSVDLTTRWGRFEDRYVDQIRVDPAPAKPLPPAYPPEMEGQQTTALNLPCCQYWARFQGGKITLTGHYFTAAGQKVNYTSLPITNFSPAYPAAGLFALANGTGYHVYQTEARADESDASAVYIITRMSGADVAVLHRLPVQEGFRLAPAPDHRFWTVTYTAAGGQKRKLILD